MLRRRAFVLLEDQEVADAAFAVAIRTKVPKAPTLALHVMHDLCGIIEVVNIFSLRPLARRMLAQHLDAILQSRVFRTDAAVLATQKPNRSHGERGWLTWPVSKMTAFIRRSFGRGFYRIEKTFSQFESVLGHTQAGHLSAFQCHQLPARHRGITAVGRLGTVAPAAAGTVLSVDDEVDGSLGRQLKAWIGSQAVSLTHGDGGNAVRVHVAAVGTVLALLADEPVDGAFDGLAVVFLGSFARFVGDASAQERQQAEGSGCDIIAVGGAGLAVAAKDLASRPRFLTGVMIELMERPPAVLRLV